MTTGRVAPRRLLWIAAMIIALIGPPLVAFGSFHIAARGTALPLPLAVGLACLAPIMAVAVLARRSRRIGAAALVRVGRSAGRTRVPCATGSAMAAHRRCGRHSLQPRGRGGRRLPGLSRPDGSHIAFQRRCHSISCSLCSMGM